MKLNFKSALMTALLAITSLVGTASANAVTLKRVQITDGSRVDLLLDGKVSPKQIRTEFFNDIIQISLTDVSVYPAKINSIAGTELTKVFAYQYAPKLTRCRISVKGSAESYKDRFEVKADGKVISLRMAPKGAAPKEKEEIATDPASAEEKALLDRVMNADAAQKAAPKAEAPTAPKAVAPKAEAPAPASDSRSASWSKEAAKEAARDAGENTPIPAPKKSLGGAKPLPSPLRSIAMLGVVLCLFVAVAWGVKKARGGTTAGAALNGHKGLGKLISQFGGTKNKMIEVVANHYLGPKKSISVVRIGGRMLVLGVTNESINLITQMGEEPGAQSASAAAQAFDLEALAMESIEPQPLPQAQAARRYNANPAPQGTGAVAAGPASFSQMVSSETSKLTVGPQSASVRSQIRNRLEGMKQL